MRSSKFFLIFLLLIFCINLNGQLFVGGNISFNSSSTNHDGATPPYKSSNYDIMFGPNVGKFLSDKLAVGINLNLSFHGQKNYQNSGSKSNSSEIGLSPFLRYYAIRWNKFSVFGEGNVGISFLRSKNHEDGITTEGTRYTSIFLRIHPGLSYDISDKISLETSLNILSLGYSYSISKDDFSNDKSFGFNFGAGLGSIISLNAVTIGAIFKF